MNDFDQAVASLGERVDPLHVSSSRRSSSNRIGLRHPGELWFGSDPVKPREQLVPDVWTQSREDADSQLPSG